MAGGEQAAARRRWTAASARGEPRRPAVGVGAYDEPAAQPGRVRVLDHGGERDRAAGLDVVGDLAELGEGLPVDPLDEDVEDAAAGEPDRERVVVGDAVALQHRHAGRDHRSARARRPRPRRSRPRPSRPPVPSGPTSIEAPGRAGRGLEGRHHGADTDRLAGPPPLHQLRQHVTHGRPPPASSAYVASEWPATKSWQWGKRGEHPLLDRLVAGLAAVRVHPHHAVREPAQPAHLLAEQRRVAALPAVAEDHDDRAAGHPALAPPVEEEPQRLPQPGAAGPVRHRLPGARPARARGPAAAARGSSGSAGCRR